MFTLYLERGVAGEVEVAAAYVAELLDERADPPALVELVGTGPRARAAATAFEGAAAREGLELERHERGSGPIAALARPSIVVAWVDELPDAWLDDEHLVALITSERVLGQAIPPADRLLSTYPYALPGRELPRIYRVRAWLRARGSSSIHERIQLETYLAANVTEHALVHLVDRWSRDDFVESVEHELENTLDPGVFVNLALGPGQRFASKGAYMIQRPGGQPAPRSDWIVPTRRPARRPARRPTRR